MSYFCMALLLVGCGREASPPVSNPTAFAKPTLAVAKVTSTPEPPLTFPRNQFLSIESLLEEHPKDHRLTIVYFDGMQGAGDNQLARLREKGLLKGLDDLVRLVAPVMADTNRNQDRLWFPFVVEPWQDSQKNLGDRSFLDEATNTLLPIIDREARLLNGDYSRVYLFGYSQGGMMASWVGLIGNRAVGAVINLHGAFPVSDLDEVPPNGRNVFVHHVHDPQDICVRYDFADRGRKAAQRAGALGYNEIIHTEVPGKSHHGFSTKVVGETNVWLTDRLRLLKIL